MRGLCVGLFLLSFLYGEPEGEWGRRECERVRGGGGGRKKCEKMRGEKK